jgi:hypothetical protein
MFLTYKDFSCVIVAYPTSIVNDELWVGLDLLIFDYKEARKTGKIQILKPKFFIHGFMGS